MRIATLRRHQPPPGLPGLLGVARVDVRTRDLLRRLRPGDIAVIDHLDLDQGTAAALVSTGVSAVVNASPSSSGRYPNQGPEVVVAAGVVLLDGVGRDVLRTVADGETLRLDGDTLYRDATVLAQGDRLGRDDVRAAMASARAGLGVHLETFTANAVEHLRREQDVLLDGADIPRLRTPIDDRLVLVVVAGPGWRDDLHRLRRWIADDHPVLVGVDEAADGLIALGHRPDVVLGELEAVSDRALRCGAELVLHVARDGRAPAQERLEDLGLVAARFQATGTGEDLALLLADAAGARLIVLAGSHVSLTDLLDQGRAETPGAFLTRLRIGTRLLDARAVSALYRPRPRVWPLVTVLALAVAGLLAAVAFGGGGALGDTVLGDWWRSGTATIRGLLSR